jgi:hypothetical protein
MIIKSNERSNAKQLASHLMSKENEHSTFTDSRGVLGVDVADALAEMTAIAKGSRASKPLFHVQYSPDPDQPMDTKKRERMFNLYEQVQGLQHLQFIEVEHKKGDRTHWHRVYNRVNPNTMTAKNLSWSKKKRTGL